MDCTIPPCRATLAGGGAEGKDPALRGVAAPVVGPGPAASALTAGSQPTAAGEAPLSSEFSENRRGEHMPCSCCCTGLQRPVPAQPSFCAGLECLALPQAAMLGNRLRAPLLCHVAPGTASSPLTPEPTIMEMPRPPLPRTDWLGCQAMPTAPPLMATPAAAATQGWGPMRCHYGFLDAKPTSLLEMHQNQEIPTPGRQTPLLLPTSALVLLLPQPLQPHRICNQEWNSPREPHH